MRRGRTTSIILYSYHFLIYTWDFIYDSVTISIVKIGFFTDGYLPQLNGVATSVEAWAKELEKLGHKVYIIAPKYSGYQDKSDRVIRLPSLKVLDKPDIRLGFPFSIKSINKIYKLQLDIIHATSGGSISALGLITARARKIPYIFTYYTRWNHFVHYFFKGKLISPAVAEKAMKIFCNKCDCIIVPMPITKDELISFGVKKPIIVIPGGVDLAKFKQQEKGFLRQKTGIRGGKILLYVGRLEKEKSVDFLLKAFQLIHIKNKETNLVLVGDGTMKKSLEQLAEDLGVRENVYFAGLIGSERMSKVYSDADIFVFASQTETQGMVVLEALSNSLPVVAVNDEVYNGIIKNKINGALVNTHEDFAKACLEILNDDQYKKKLSQSARKSMEKFSLFATAKSFEKLYKKLIVKRIK